MGGEITLDKAGRMVLPKAVRDALRVGPGDTLRIESDDERIILSPVRQHAGLHKEHGVWVYRSGTPVSRPLAELVNEQRDQRLEDLTGKRH